jgi:hypothetical protein
MSRNQDNIKYASLDSINDYEPEGLLCPLFRTGSREPLRQFYDFLPVCCDLYLHESLN